MLSLKNVCKSFGDNVAVRDLDVEVHRGEVLGLLGPNGAGKTTSIRMAVGLLRPDSGEVLVTADDGTTGSPTEPRVRRALGVAPQSLSLYDNLTAAENLRVFGALFGLAGRPLAARIAELLDMVGLTDRAGDRVAGYSGGMKRRLNLAAALVHNPRVVLLDEPTAGVDPQSRHSLLELVGRIRSEGAAVIYTTHYMEEAQKVCDRVAIMDHGRLLAMDTVDGLIASHGGSSVVVAESPAGAERRETAEPLKDVAELLARGDVTTLRIDRPDLETVFLNLTGRSLRD